MMYLHVYMNMNSQELKNNENIKWTLKKKRKYGKRFRKAKYNFVDLI